MPLPWATTTAPARRFFSSGQSERSVGAFARSSGPMPWTLRADHWIGRSVCRWETKASACPPSSDQDISPICTGVSVMPGAAPADSKSMAVKRHWWMRVIKKKESRIKKRSLLPMAAILPRRRGSSRQARRSRYVAPMHSNKALP